ncbi:MAG: GNAT family N-acetyltransferase [Clostridia bacterium]|nr:GNAT family N-acetyltransferase [Clostridia bacterium]
MQIDKVIYRKANLNDSIAEITRAIYLTDDYIYPALHNIYEEFLDCIRESLIDKNSVFCIDNLLVAEYEGKIIALACVIKGKKDYHFCDKYSQNYSIVNDGYFKPLCDEAKKTQGYIVVNFCVLPEYRGNGVSTGLITYITRLFGENDIYLDVILDNRIAVHVYEKAGFITECEYNGFTSEKNKTLPCLKMKYSK